MNFSGRHCLFLLVFLIACKAGWAFDGVALVMAAEGDVFRLDKGGEAPVQVYSALKHGDRLRLQPGGRLRLLYAKGGRQEIWSGSGGLEVEAGTARANGLPAPAVSVLALPVANQILKMPMLDGQGQVSMLRLRSIPTPEALARLEQDFRRLRAEAALDDLNPHLFLLAGLLEMRETGRLEQALTELQMSHPGNVEAKVIVSLYRKALRNLRQ